MFELTLPAPHRGCHEGYRRSLAALDPRRAAPSLGEHLIERPLVDEHTGDEAHRKPARSQACRHGRGHRLLRLGLHVLRLSLVFG